MESGPRDRTKALYYAALAQPIGERSTFLARACGDDEVLRREIELLLNQTISEVSPLGPPPGEADRTRMESLAAHGDGLAPIARGTFIGPYQVQTLVGSGGMGVVYRARDTRLNREVALKVLRSAYALQPDRVARFKREAQVLASLNDPCIATVYDFEIANGAQALIQELVDGPTLAETLARGPIPLDDALAVARQVAQALGAAHDKGVIHRDLKPANIKVRSDGSVKVLDFGIAKRVPAGSWDPIGVHDITSPGVVVGTAAYMPPEQAKGEDVTRSADVWAFGCVLFEMLAGKRAFGGETTSEVLAAVLKTDPDWQQLPADTPEPIRRLLRRCLQKDRRIRLHDMADVYLELVEASTASAPTVVGRFVKWERLGWIAVVIALAAVAAVALSSPARRAMAPSAQEMRVEITTPPTTDPASLAVSPDGRQVAFVATSHGRPLLWVRRLDGIEPRPLAGTDLASGPFWSPDGRRIGFFADQKLKRVDIEDGRVQALARVELGLGGSWMPDGTILFAGLRGGLISRVGENGGAVSNVTKVLPNQLGHRFPHVLPDGTHFLYYVPMAAGAGEVWAAGADGADARSLLPSDSAAVYASDHLLFVHQGMLYATPFDAATLRVMNKPFVVSKRAAVEMRFGRPALSAARDGPLLYREFDGARRQFTWFDRSGRAKATVGERGQLELLHPSLSPDDRYVSLARSFGGNSDIWLLDTARGALSRFTSDPGNDIFPVWSADGTRILFSSQRVSRTGSELYVRSVTEGQDHLVFAPESAGLNSALLDDWSADGRTIVFRDLSAKGGYDLWALPPNGTPVPFVKTEFEEGGAQFSPDDKWLAYQSDESGRAEIYVRPFPGPGSKLQISTAGGTQVRWSRGSNELFYIGPDGFLMAVRITRAGGVLDAGEPMPLFDARALSGLPGQGNYRQQYMVSQDGQRFLIYTVVEEDRSPIVAVLNWKPRS
jgi:eukaryotic-like serine/threonine-protein kinase